MARIHPSLIATGECTKIMVYSHDAFGLGNIRRMLAICKYLLKSIPNLSILLLSGSPMLQSFRLPKGLDYIKLPCLNRGQSGKIAVKYLNADIQAMIQLRSELIFAAAKNYQPDLILVDKKPSGIQGELNSTINYLKHNLPATRFVLLLRDILDTPAKTVREWQREGYFQQVELVYDRILVVGSPEIFDLRREYKFNTAIASKLFYCGYIRKESGLKNRRTIRQELNLQPDEKLVLVTPGGGEDGYNLIHNYLAGLTQYSDRFKKQKIRSLIFCGAEMPLAEQQQIHRQAAAHPNVTVLEFTNDLMSYVNIADAVICMCGYNTITEVLQKGKKAIVVPRIKPGREQLIRARRMAKAGLLDTIHPDVLQPQLLIDTLFNSLARVKPPLAFSNLDFQGLPKVADYLARELFHALYLKQTQEITLRSA